MRVISKKRLKDFWESLPAAKSSLEQWYKVVSGAKWLHFADLRKTFNHTDAVKTEKGHPVVIFDVGGNKYRIIAALHYDRNICYVLRVLTHKQYDTNQMEKGFMSTKIKGDKTATLPKTYRELCGLLLPRKIHDDTESEAAQEIMDVLAVLPTRTSDQDDYLETLAELVEAYEEHTVKFSKRSVLETLKFLLAENRLTASDLSRLLGTDISLGYRIVSGERHLTTRHIKKLARHFHVGPEVFL